MTVASSLDQDAAAAAESAGVRVRLLTSSDEMIQASRLLGQVWQLEPPRSPVEPALMTALSHIGGYVAAAYRGPQMVGVCVGLFHPPEKAALHSQVAGVAAGSMSAGIGRALKYHQRAWAADAGLREITWTFDPLVARNAFFNIHRLGCDVTEYLPDFYGGIGNGLNRGTLGDRMMVSWSVSQARPRSEGDDLPDAVLLRAGTRPDARAIPASARTLRVEIPEDIERLRTTDLHLAQDWRLTLRQTMTALRANEWRIVDFDRRGFYRMNRKAG